MNEHLETPANGGFVAFVAERIGGLDRRLEEMGRGLHERLNRQEQREERNLVEMRRMHKGAEDARDESEDERDVRITDVERTVQMVKGGLLVISALVVPAALVVLDHVLR